MTWDCQIEGHDVVPTKIATAPTVSSPQPEVGAMARPRLLSYYLWKEIPRRPSQATGVAF